jgi:succinyl-diaminopimelate desuccinylase
MTQLNSVVDLCRELVRIPSENPAGAEDSGGEEAIARFVGELLQHAGAEVTYEEIAPGRPNVYGIFPAPAGAPRILFAPHLDTVPARGMAIDPFAAELRDGRIYGRGACDTKGPMAAMLWALMTAAREGIPAALSFAGLADEEQDQIGARLCAQHSLADFVVVGEPTELETIHAHKGTAWMRATTTGVAAHGSAPERGINAIDRMTDFLNRLQRVFRHYCPESATLGSPTLSIGTIRGGSKINVVPDRCVAEIDVRTVPGQENLVEELGRWIATENIEVELEALKVSAPLNTDPNHPMVRRLAAAGSSLATAPWFCDAAVFAAAGTPAVAIGPGSIRQAHTTDEFIETTELERSVDFYLRFLRSLGESEFRV